jgi:hypothetical protein
LKKDKLIKTKFSALRETMTWLQGHALVRRRDHIDDVNEDDYLAYKSDYDLIVEATGAVSPRPGKKRPEGITNTTAKADAEADTHPEGKSTTKTHTPANSASPSGSGTPSSTGTAAGAASGSKANKSLKANAAPSGTNTTAEQPTLVV